MRHDIPVSSGSTGIPTLEGQVQSPQCCTCNLAAQDLLLVLNIKNRSFN